MNYQLFLAKRLSLGNGNHGISPAVNVAVIAVAIAVIVMIASSAIVLGFKKEIREKIVGFNGHISIYKMPINEYDDNLLTINNFIEETLDSFPFITEYTEQAAIPAILKTKNDFKGVYMRGLQEGNATSYIQKNLEEGKIPNYDNEDEKNNILISRIAANQLKLQLGDKIETYFISDDIRVRKLEIAGIFNSHFDQYDDVLIFGGMPLVAQLGNLPAKTGTYLTVITDNFDNIAEYTYLLQDYFTKASAYGETQDYYRVDNVLNQGRGFLSWLSLLDTNVIVIIILMMIVGSITLISGMLIIILERKKFIGLMRTLGASTSKIRNIFIFIAIRIAIFGLFIGDFVSLLIIYFQYRYHFIHLDADAYYIDFVPVDLPFWIVTVLNIGILIVTYLILVLPSRFVGKISPSESMIRND